MATNTDACQIYAKYVEKYRYPPKQPQHLIAFSKSKDINKPIKYKDAKNIINNAGKPINTAITIGKSGKQKVVSSNNSKGIPANNTFLESKDINKPIKYKDARNVIKNASKPINNINTINTAITIGKSIKQKVISSNNRKPIPANNMFLESKDIKKPINVIKNEGKPINTINTINTARAIGKSGKQKVISYNNSKRIPRNNSFLERIINGDIESAVQYGEINEISYFLPIITGLLAQRAFVTDFCDKKLLSIFEEKCESNPFLLQSFYFFIYSYFTEKYVKMIWNKHPIYQFVLKNHINLLCIPVYQRQKQILYGLYNSLNDENKIGRNYGFKLPSKKSTKLSSYYKLNNFNINHIEYDGYNILELFEIFTFDNMDLIHLNFGDNDDIYNNIKIEIEPGFKVDIISRNNKFCDPLNGNNNLSTVKVKSIFKSNAKPLLLSLYCNKNQLSSQMIFKKGDDLRKDTAILTMFRLFNDIWKLGKLKYNQILIESYTYKCIPMGPNYGCIEFISDCIPLTDIKKHYFNKIGDIKFINKLIATSIGSYVGSYIMGIRDRHSDNILIKSDGTLFHIDYGYVLGETLTGLDAEPFAITNDLQLIMGQKGWNIFVHYSLLAFLLLRDKYKDILFYAKMTLRFLEWNKVEMFLKQQFKLNINDNDIAQYFTNCINAAPNAWKTKMKNTIHSIAINVKK